MRGTGTRTRHGGAWRGNAKRLIRNGLRGNGTPVGCQRKRLDRAEVQGELTRQEGMVSDKDLSLLDSIFE